MFFLSELIKNKGIKYNLMPLYTITIIKHFLSLLALKLKIKVSVLKRIKAKGKS